jgi:4-hydroxy-tetrahydrodipicolinate synthase
MTSKLVQFYKAGLDRIGRYGGPSRPPRGSLTKAEEDVLDAALDALAGVQRQLVP